MFSTLSVLAAGVSLCGLVAALCWRSWRSGGVGRSAGGRNASGSWAAGAVGEEYTGRVLAGLPGGYTVAHDLQIIGSRGGVRANIDHVVITPSGQVVVIDTKNWAGVLNSDGSRFYSGSDRGPGGPRGKAVDTLVWEASMLGVRPDSLIIAVTGSGRLSSRELRAGPVVAVRAEDVPELLARLDRQGRARRFGRPGLRKVMGPNVVLPN